MARTDRNASGYFRCAVEGLVAVDVTLLPEKGPNVGICAWNVTAPLASVETIVDPSKRSPSTVGSQVPPTKNSSLNVVLGVLLRVPFTISGSPTTSDLKALVRTG